MTLQKWCIVQLKVYNRCIRTERVKAMKAYFAGGRYNNMEMDTQDILNSCVWNGQLTEDLSELRAKGICVHRAELDNQPKVNGYLGPMWDGDGLRYETQEVYDMLSY